MQMIGGIVSLLLVLLYGVASLVTVRKAPAGRTLFLRQGVAPFVEWLRWARAMDRFPSVLHRPRTWLSVLEGGTCPPDRLLRWMAEVLASAYAVGLSGWMLTFITGNLLAGWGGSLLACAMPALRLRDLNRQVERRRQILLLELPVLLSRLLVLVNAGENVWRALARSAGGPAAKGHPLYDELNAALTAMKRGESMSLAMEEFGRRCALPEAKLFTAVLLMNARRGGEDFVPALRELTRRMWEKRKAAARMLGEQASSRLAFPLAVIFLLIIVLLGAPALMVM